MINEWMSNSLKKIWIQNIKSYFWWAMGVNRSGRSPKMSDHERFAQVAHQKWATMRESLRLFTKNERMSESLVFLSESPIRSFFRKKTSDSLRKPLSQFPALHYSPQEPGLVNCSRHLFFGDQTGPIKQWQCRSASALSHEILSWWWQNRSVHCMYSVECYFPRASHYATC